MKLDRGTVIKALELLLGVLPSTYFFGYFLTRSAYFQAISITHAVSGLWSGGPFRENALDLLISVAALLLAVFGLLALMALWILVLSNQKTRIRPGLRWFLISAISIGILLASASLVFGIEFGLDAAIFALAASIAVGVRYLYLCSARPAIKAN